MLTMQYTGPVVHPGEILKKEFLVPLNITQTDLANEFGISPYVIQHLVNGKKCVIMEIAFLLAKRFGTTPNFWLHLQANWDVAKYKEKLLVKGNRETK